MKNQTLTQLMQALFQTIGNKRYLYDLEKMIVNLELTPEQLQTVSYLIRDILDLEQHKRKGKSWHRMF